MRSTEAIVMLDTTSPRRGQEGFTMRYDARKAPDAEGWLELDEQDRIDQIIEYHRRRRLPVGENARAHATAHAIVENQVALGDVTVVPATLDRLMREGLDRHDAIHAIASVLMGVIFDAFRNPEGQPIDINDAYGRQLAELTAASWRAT
jgi:hypothetical protein